MSTTVTIIEKRDDYLVARLQNVDAAYVNTLRRIAMTEVPTLAVERIELGKNNSIMYDEMLAHRIGLVPLTTDLAGYSMKEQHGEPGNPSNEVQLTLRVSGKGKSSVVTAGEFTTSDPKVKPVHDGMPLVTILEGQDIELVAYAELGMGRDHMKWSPCLATHKHYPHITITKQPKNAKKVADRYPGVFEVRGDKLVVMDNGGAALPDVELDLDDGEATIENKDDFIIEIESWGQLPAVTILEEALRRYTEQLEAFTKTL